MPLQSVLDKVLDHKIKARLCRTLCKSGTGWTGRKLAKELNVSPTTAGKFLKELVKDGIVVTRSAGMAYLYSINNDDYTVKTILKPFFSQEEKVFGKALSVIKNSLLRTGAGIVSLAIFGSVARKEDTAKSDIDLLIVLESSKEKKALDAKLDMMVKEIARKFQSVAAPYIVTAPALKRRYNARDPLIREIFRSYILVYGKPLERLVV